MACAFGKASCRNVLSTKYIRLPELLEKLAIVRGEDNYKKSYEKL